LIKVLEKQHENPEADSSGSSRIIIEEKRRKREGCHIREIYTIVEF
jgi:hypothetical protein